MKRFLPLLLASCVGGPTGPGKDTPRADDTDVSADTDVSTTTESTRARWRLSAFEIERTVADVLKVDVPTSLWLPPDVRVEGFTHLDDGVTLTSEFVDDLEVWAGAVADAVVHPTSPIAVQQVAAWQAEELPWSGGVRSSMVEYPFTVFWLVGEPETAAFEVPADGDWSLQMMLVGRVGTDGPFSATVEVDGEEIGAQAFDGSLGAVVNADVSTTLALTAGTHALALSPDFTRADPLPDLPLGAEYYPDRGSYLGIDAITLTAVDPTLPDIPESDVLTCADDPPESRECADTVLRRALQGLWRRPLSEGETNRTLGVFDAAQQDGLSWADSVGQALVAVLLSPSFVFHEEAGHDAQDPEGRALWPYVMADRLSYALWQSAPDAALLACAAAGGLTVDDAGECGLWPQARRMLDDPRAEVLVDEFAMRWLGVHDVDSLWLINRVFPRYTVDLLSDEKRETAALFRELWRGDRDLHELLTADHTWATWRVADLYGLDAPSQTELTRVEYAGADRAGILGHASVLTATAKGTDPTSVDRATWVMRNLLCQTLPTPPANVPPLPPGSDPITERFEDHVSAPFCATCHGMIDPYGLPLSRFDALGERRRDGSGADPVTLRDGTEVTDVREYATWLAAQPDFDSCVVRRVLTWVTGHNQRSSADARVAALTEQARANGFSFDAILEAILRDPAFSAPVEGR